MRGNKRMKYTTSVEINLPRKQAFELFTNSDRYSEWQESLVSQERLEGEPGKVGTRTRLLHKMSRREVEMLETITRRELPELLIATYEAKGVWNEAVNHFSEQGENQTTWLMDTEFRCSGFMWLLTTFAPGMFKKETQKTMDAFKAFAEKTSGGQAQQDA